MTPFIVSIPYTIWHHKQLFPGMWTSLENALHRDAEFLTRLWTFDKATLAYGLLQYRHRWSSRDDRVAVLAGDLRKLGLFPALAALFISVISAAILFKGNNNPSLLILQGFVAIDVVVGIHYLIAFNAFLSRERPQQVILLLEYAIQHTDQCNTIPSDANHYYNGDW